MRSSASPVSGKQADRPPLGSEASSTKLANPMEIVLLQRIGFRRMANTGNINLPSQRELEIAVSEASTAIGLNFRLRGVRAPLGGACHLYTRTQSEFIAPGSGGVEYSVIPIYNEKCVITDIFWFGGPFVAGDWIRGSDLSEPWFLSTGRGAVLNGAALSAIYTKDNPLKMFDSPKEWAVHRTGVMPLKRKAIASILKAGFVECESWDRAKELDDGWECDDEQPPRFLTGPQDEQSKLAYVFRRRLAALRLAQWEISEPPKAEARRADAQRRHETTHGPDLGGRLRYVNGTLHEWQRRLSPAYWRGEALCGFVASIKDSAQCGQ